MTKIVRSISAFVREIPANVDESRTIEFIISDATKDRHGTVVNPDGWMLDNYVKNPIVGYNHNYGRGLFSAPNPDNIIGKSSLRIENKQLIGAVTFEPEHINAKAEKIFQKVKFGTLRAASVGFAEIGEGRFGEGEEARGGKAETYYFKGQELYEWSVVDIPSNPAAVKRQNYKDPTIAEILNKYAELSKEFDEEKLKELSIIDFLKSIEGMVELSVPRRKQVERNLLRNAETRLRLANIR